MNMDFSDLLIQDLMKNVEEPMKISFEYGAHMLPPFRYTGLNVEKSG